MLLKRLLDLTLSIISLALFGWLILILILIAFFDCGGKGLFLQNRIGQHGKLFKIFKICTIHPYSGHISTFGKFLRKSKLDELPQLVNILIGQMCFVGPRPDIAGYYDRLEGKERILLALKPGLCSSAALKYYNEEALLAQQQYPLKYNDDVIFPDKVAMNLEYYQNRSLFKDIKILSNCFLGFLHIVFIKKSS
jgi:lipopolysaccharide/colanic/teichoic acid biosynthesis glycosyltransferase